MSSRRDFVAALAGVWGASMACHGTVNLGNLTGYPSLVLPCGFDSRGLPIGLQIYGRPFEEERVLAFARGYEQSTEWHLKRPSL